MNFKYITVALTTWVAVSANMVSAEPKVDAGLKDYSVASGVAGNFSSVGSDTLANLMTLWAEDFKRFYPNVNIQIQAAGSSTAPPALTEGTSNLGPMSRKMKDKEIASFEEKYGYKPTAVPVAIDALAVFAHKDNPIEGLSIEQVDAIFQQPFTQLQASIRIRVACAEVRNECSTIFSGQVGEELMYASHDEKILLLTTVPATGIHAVTGVWLRLPVTRRADDWL